MKSQSPLNEIYKKGLYGQVIRVVPMKQHIGGSNPPVVDFFRNNSICATRNRLEEISNKGNER